MEHDEPVECEDMGTFMDLNKFMGRFDGEIVKPFEDQELKAFQEDGVVLVFDASEILAWYTCIRTIIEGLRKDIQSN